MYPKLVTVSQGPCSKGPGLPQSDPLLGLVVGLCREETFGVGWPNDEKTLSPERGWANRKLSTYPVS